MLRKCCTSPDGQRAVNSSFRFQERIESVNGSENESVTTVF